MKDVQILTLLSQIIIRIQILILIVYIHLKSVILQLLPENLKVYYIEIIIHYQVLV